MRTRQDRIFQIIGHAIMILLSLCAVVPLILLVISSITDNDTLVRNGYSFLPEKLSLYAYEYIFKTGSSVIRAYGISIVLTVVGTILSLAITTLLAYAISKKDLPGRGLLTFYVFLTMLFNGGLVPTYLNYTNTFGIKNTFWALLIPGLITNGFYILLMKSYFSTSIPYEITEAAIIDGANSSWTQNTDCAIGKADHCYYRFICRDWLLERLAEWLHLFDKENGSVFHSELIESYDSEYPVSDTEQFKHQKCRCRSGSNSISFGQNGHGCCRYSPHFSNLSVCAK